MQGSSRTGRRSAPEPDLILARSASALSLGALGLLAVALVLIVRGWTAALPEGFVSWQGQLAWALGAVGAPVLGGLVAARRPQNAYGWVWLGYAAALTTLVASQAYVSYAVAVAPGLPASGVVAVLADAAWALWLAHIPFLLLLFPTGRLPGRRWRWVALAAVTGAATVVGAGALAPDLGTVPLDNPWGTQGPTGEAARGLANAGVYAVFAAIVASSLSLVSRFRAGRQEDRRQITWFAYAAAVVAASFVVDPFFELPGVWDSVLETLTLGFLYVAVGVAILRHGLYDIDRILNRTLVYVTLTALLVGTYVLAVGYLGSVFQDRQTAVVSLLATGLIAVVFAPLRDRLQQLVNQLMYGDRLEPYAVLSDLARKLEVAPVPEEVLTTIVDTVARSLDLRGVELWYVENTRMRLGAAHGNRPDQDVVDDLSVLTERRAPALVIPLSHRGATVGALCLDLPEGRAELSRGDAALVRDLAAHAGPATHAVGLTADLQASLAELRRSRERLVAAQQEERLRIHRDLHDGLGPVLAGMRLRLEACLDTAQAAAGDEAHQPPAALITELERLHRMVGEATSDVRTLVHDLHPPALAQLGLVGAVRQHCDRFARETGLEVELTTDVDAPLPAAAQVALLRIVQESLVNVHKHADASHVCIRLQQTERELTLSVQDDGIGAGPDLSGGAGIESMRTRAELLGGRVVLQSGDGTGTLVSVRIPIGGWSDERR